MAEEQGFSQHGKQERRRSHRTGLGDRQLVGVQFGEARSGLVVDLSEGGLGIEPFTPLRLGQRSPVGFALPDAQRSLVRATGEVVWTSPAGRTGVEFVDIPPHSAEALKQWCQQEQAAPVPARERPAGNLMGELSVELIGGRLSQEAALDLVVRTARKVTQATGAAIAVRNTDGFICCASAGMAPDVGVRLQAESGLTGQCIRTAEIVLCEDSQYDLRVSVAAARALRLGSAMILPLMATDTVAGVFAVFSDEPRHFWRTDLDSLKTIESWITTYTLESKPASAPSGVETSANVEAAAAAPAAQGAKAEKAKAAATEADDAWDWPMTGA